MEFNANINPNDKPVCDVESPAGLNVVHNLVVELIIAEEHCPNKNTRLITPTGAARVLRMQFKVIVTQRSGLGISWDEEQPPMYEDVPASPPTYQGSSVEDYGGPPLEYEELERMDRPSPQIRAEGVNDTTPVMRPRGSSTQAIAGQVARFSLDDLETAPVFRERVSDDIPEDPEDMRQGLSGA